jgi:hypothetical protein
MLRLFFVMYTLAFTVLAGSAIVAALTMNLFDLRSILIAAALGAIAALPVAWVIARKVSEA